VALACGLGLLMPTLASAQSAAQRFPGVIDRPVPEVPLPPAPRALPPLGGTPTPESVPDANAPIPTITSVQFSGNAVLSNAQLQKVAAPYLNRPLTRGDLAKFKYDIAKRYYASGYILVRVVTPPNQDLSKGVLNVTVYEAKIEKIETGKDAAVRPFITRAIISEVRPGSVFNETDVESMVRDLDDLHGAKASVNLVPGSQVGTTDLEVKVEKTNDFQQQVSVNNYGSKLTGEWLFNGNFQYGNLLGLGELYTFDFTHSNSSLLTVRGGIQTPIGWMPNSSPACRACIAGEDVAGAFARYEAHRKPRTSRIQAISSANTWMKGGNDDTSWLYGYDAWNDALAYA